MSNNNTITELRVRIRTLVKEEIKSSLKEEIFPQFKRIRNKKAFSAWIMRQFFNPAKHVDKIWYDPSVTADNVIEKLSDLVKKGVFPATPEALSRTWKLKNKLSSAMGEMDKEERREKNATAPDLGKNKVSYRTGESTLANVAKSLGGMSKTMVNKIETKAMDDFKSINLGKHPKDIGYDEQSEINNKIDAAREDAVNDYVSLLHDSSSVDDFIEKLRKQRILSPSDIKMINPQERFGIEFLMGKDSERAKMILLQDIEEDSNMFKTFQSAVYRKVFPAGKVGRPRKIKN